MYGIEGRYSYIEMGALSPDVLRAVWDVLKFFVSVLMIVVGLLLANGLGLVWLLLALAGVITLIVALITPTEAEQLTYNATVGQTGCTATD